MQRSTALGALIAGLLLSVLATAVPAPAAAESGSIVYRQGDRPAFMDLTRITARNGPNQARIELYVRDLGDRGAFRLDITHPDGLKGAYARVRHPASGGRYVEFRRWKSGNDVDRRIDCPRQRLKWQTGRDRIVFTIPQRCLRWYFPPPRDWVFSGTSYSSLGVNDVIVSDDGRGLRLTRG